MGASLPSAPKPVSSSEDLQAPPAKRPREGNRSVNNCPMSDHVIAKSKMDQFFFAPSANIAWLMPTSFCLKSQQSSWESLPYVALVEIFRHLPNNDKYNAALACRAWQLAFNRPALWRRGHFQFNGLNEWRALSFVSLMGAALRHIEVDCSASGQVRSSWPSKSAKNLSIFLRCLLNSNNRHVSTFKLSYLQRLARHLVDPEFGIIQLLSRFLAAQEVLTLLDLRHASLGADQAFELLGILNSSCESTLQSLTIGELIGPTRGDLIASDPRLLSLLARFTALRELVISHRYLSDDLLFLLASTLSLTLTQISVWADVVLRVEGAVTPRAWRHLALRCPNLKASFFVKGARRSQCVKEILTTGAPLAELCLNISGCSAKDEIATCLQHIVNFHETLQYLRLNLQFPAISIEDDVAAVVEKCFNLKTLSIFAVAKTPDFQDARMGMKVRRAVSRQGRSPSSLEEVTFNDCEIPLEVDWTLAFTDWLCDCLETRFSRTGGGLTSF